MQRISFEIEGIAPLKMDRYHGLPDPKTPDGYQKQAEEKCYRDEAGYLAMPSNAIKAVIRYASSDLGKKMEGKKNRQTIQSSVFISPAMLSLGTKKHDGLIADLVTRGKGDKVTRVISYRPLINKWKVSGTMNVLSVPPNFIKQCLELGGIRYGLLGHRPEFGRFVITKFEVEK